MLIFYESYHIVVNTFAQESVMLLLNVKYNETSRVGGHGTDELFHNTNFEESMNLIAFLFFSKISLNKLYSKEIRRS